MAEDTTHSDMDEVDEYEYDGSPGDAHSPAPSKRPRGQPVERVQPSPHMPHDVRNAMIKLRISKEKAFIQSADGRTRNGAGQLWTAISDELATEFLHRDDVSSSALHPRALGKKWSYVEKTFKVCVFRYY